MNGRRHHALPPKIGTACPTATPIPVPLVQPLSTTTSPVTAAGTAGTTPFVSRVPRVLTAGTSLTDTLRRAIELAVANTTPSPFVPRPTVSPTPQFSLDTSALRECGRLALAEVTVR